MVGEIWRQKETEETGQNLILNLYVCLSYNLVATLHFRKVAFILRNANENYICHTHAK